MEELEYALRMIPPGYRDWVVRSVRSGSATPQQVAARFSMSEQDPAYQPMIRGFERIKIVPESYLHRMMEKVMNQS
jgi:hypothetical protein